MRILTISLAAFIMMTMAAFKGNKSLTVTRSAFTNDGQIPAKYSCVGQQASPPLTFTNIPKKTKSLALIVHDPEGRVGGFTHWVVWNIDPAAGGIPEDYKAGDGDGLNGLKKAGYKSLCPPTGAHHYHFMVYALDVKLTIDKTTSGKEELEKAMEGHILAQGDLVGLFDKTYK